jgi:hypothetical protein
MYLNQFSVRVPEGSERTSGYVEIDHGKQYTIVLRNSHGVRCDVEVSIDGKAIGTFRIAANSVMRLERKPGDGGRFTFYRLGSSEGDAADLASVSASDLGLIKAVFTPEHNLWGYYQEGTRDPCCDYTVTCDSSHAINVRSITSKMVSTSYCSTGNAPGGTGLSGHSDQQFIGVDSIWLDYSQQTTIYLRLVEANHANEPRPLRPVMNSSPIPPPIDHAARTVTS